MVERNLENSLIFKRHSCRSYAQGDISSEQLDHVLHAAMAGPSAHNSQPWAFVVIDEREKLEAIASFHPYAKMVKNASCAILVCGLKEIADKNPFYQQDLGAATQNMLLAATECGVGSCWCGVHPKTVLENSFRELLRIPEEGIPFALVVLGLMLEDPVASDRYDASRVRRNGW